MKRHAAGLILFSLFAEMFSSDAEDADAEHQRHLLDTRQEEGIAWSVVIIAALLVLCYCCFIPLLSKQSGEYHSQHLIPENKQQDAGYGSTDV